MNVCACVCVHLCVEARGQSQVSQLRYWQPSFFYTKSLTWPVVHQLAWLGSGPQEASYFHLPHAEITNLCYHMFVFHGCYGSNSSPHSCKASHLSNELCPQTSHRLSTFSELSCALNCNSLHQCSSALQSVYSIKYLPWHLLLHPQRPAQC